MTIRGRIIITLWLLLLSYSSTASSPLADVMELLDSNGGIRTNTNVDEGYYVISLSFSDKKNQQKAAEEARLMALRGLTEFISGASVSGRSKVEREYISKNENGAETEFNQELFNEIIQSQFSTNLSVAKVLKQGLYNGEYFVAISISEKDTKNVGRLKEKSDERNEFADKSNTIKTVQAKGIASLSKLTTSRAREVAIQNALRNAIQQANGVAVKGRSGKLGESVTMALSAKSEGYVRSYEIIKEQNKNNDLIIDIVAEVDEGKLIRDARLYLDVFSTPVFALKTEDADIHKNLINNLQSLGFQFTQNSSSATHLFQIQVRQESIVNLSGIDGFATEYTLDLIDQETSEILFTIVSPTNKSRIFVKPKSRAKQISETAALRYLNQQLGPEIITALAQLAEYGKIYELVIENANRKDLEIFKQVLNTSTTGNVERWEWDKSNKVLTLYFRYSGTLSDALDQGMESLYSTYSTENSKRRPSASNIGKRVAEFTILSKG